MSRIDPAEEMLTHIPAMRAFAISLTHNPAVADDIVQDTLIKAWNGLEGFEPGTNMRAWLFTILRNTFYSMRRKSRREVADPDGEISGSVPIRPDHDGRLEMRDFQAALQMLPVEQREALILVGAEGFSHEEAAETCGVPVGTIKSRVNRARRRLAELLDMDETDGFGVADPATAAIFSAMPRRAV